MSKHVKLLVIVGIGAVILEAASAVLVVVAAVKLLGAG